ncbi:M20 family metallopeptidase [Rugosimonospora acidiphila]|uniref:M20 family metallopeptidase n=1 Tax=Rugosimonospora acidiphila TaxID=556531 RepID=A0ABP9SVH5_9ACTN
MSLDQALWDDTRQIAGELTELRHRLHEHPEIGLDLPVTQETVLSAISDLGLEITLGRSVSSVTAVLRGGAAAGSGTAVLLRGDMDGLPITERTGLNFASKVDGAMHACGHDLHTAMLVGAARVLSAHRDSLAGDVVFMFQPGEEGWDGAGAMLKEGVLDAAGTRVSSAYGIHVMSSKIRPGVFSTRPGTLMAASDGLFVTVRGAGGHGSAPHLAKDPVNAAAEMVTALQALVTRRFDVFDPVVITVGSFHAGTRRNIIPDEARFEATVRSFSAEAQERLRAETVRLCQSIAAAHGLEVDVEYEPEYPMTINNADHAAFVAGVVDDVFGDDRGEVKAAPSTGAEDFSRVLAEVPGCYTFLGAGPADLHDVAPDNHSPLAIFEDSVMPDGVLLHAQLAVRALARDAAAATA